jgi:hypothetical protein
MKQNQNERKQKKKYKATTFCKKKILTVKKHKPHKCTRVVVCADEHVSSIIRSAIHV